MSRPLHLFVFCYDVARDSARARLADLLLEQLTRVQQSVFEGHLTGDEARKLAMRAANHLGEDDSLRVYCITQAGRQASLAFGPKPLAEAHDFWLA